MGSCMSSRSKKGALLSSKSKAPKAKTNKKKMEEKNKQVNHSSRGEKTSFGFKRPPPQIAQVNKTLPHSTELSQSLESLVITQTARSGTPRLPRPNKDANGNCGVRTNRFGFRANVPISNKVADSHSNNVNMSIDNSSSSLRIGTNRSQSASRACDYIDVSNTNNSVSTIRQPTLQHPTRFTLHTTSLPRPQFPVRLSAPVNYHGVDKHAKTAANNHTARKVRSENGSSSGSSVTDADSGVGSQRNGGDNEFIQHLNNSPAYKNRLRNSNIQKSRPMEMVFNDASKKTFELRDLNDSIEVTEIMPLQLPPLPNPRYSEIGTSNLRELHNSAGEATSGSDEDVDDGFEEETGEEKLNRDRLISEKDEEAHNRVHYDNNEEANGAGDELWAHEEAMAGEDDVSILQCHYDSDEGSVGKMHLPLRSVLLSLEDPAFATLAAISTSTMLEDENPPELEYCDFGSSPPSLPNPNLSFAQEIIDEERKLSGSPGSPSTPTHASNSLSLSDARDFLIDDEIADQPGLVFDETITGTSSGKTMIAQNNQEVEIPSETLFTKPVGIAGRISLESTPARHNSIGTLSPCESITSDDMMLDFDRSVLDDESHDPRSLYRLDGFTSDLGQLTDVEADGELLIAKEWSSIVAGRPELMNGVRATRQLRSRVGSTGSGTDTPRSLDTPRRSGLSSPLRISRQATSSPGEDLSEDSGIWLNRSVYKHMFQDVINLKAQLLKLQRVLQDGESSNPFENTVKNGLCYAENPMDITSNVLKESQGNEQDSDCKRQVLFLEHQLQEKERTIQLLQVRLAKCEKTDSSTSRDTCNAATQTERIRPISSGPLLLSGGGMSSEGAGGSLVSNTNEYCERLQAKPSETKSNSTFYSRLPVVSLRRPVSEHLGHSTSQPVQVMLQKKLAPTKS